MKTRDWPDVARLGALVRDPARARILSALLGGQALTATELAVVAEVATSTTSAHLARLTDAGVLKVFRQGRCRYFHLFDDEVAVALEGLMALAARDAVSAHRGPSDRALAAARVCYDHLAGGAGVFLADRLAALGVIARGDAWTLTPSGQRFFTRWGLDPASLAHGRRPLCRPCLDWSERRFHLAGALGAAVLQRLLAIHWVRRESGVRTLTFSAAGDRAFRAWLGAPVLTAGVRG